MVTVSDSTNGPPIAWESWSDWRCGRRHPDRVWFRERRPPRPSGHSDWCPACAGNGTIFVFARNGEGLVPWAACPICRGTGKISSSVAGADVPQW